MSTDASDPTSGSPSPVRIAGLVRLAWEQAADSMTQAVAGRFPELRPAHLQVFSFGSLEGRRVTELANRLAVTKQSMHELVGHLERHGFLRREPDPADSRARRIRLTDRGLELEDAVRAASAQLHLDWRDQLGAQRFDALWSALQEITGRAGAPPEPGALARRAAYLDGD